MPAEAARRRNGQEDLDNRFGIFEAHIKKFHTMRSGQTTHNLIGLIRRFNVANSVPHIVLIVRISSLVVTHRLNFMFFYFCAAFKFGHHAFCAPAQKHKKGNLLHSRT